MTSGAENHLRLQYALWIGAAATALAMLAYLLVLSPMYAVIGVVVVGWLILLPYHSRIAVWVAVATFSSALIMPFFPGRPYLWEFAALLAWSGLGITLFMRQNREDYWETMKKNRWIFIGVAGYCVVLVVTMLYRGVGLRILGTAQMGGRFYFQQLTCAIFPLLFVIIPITERTLIRLFYLQCFLTATYLASDFVFSLAPRRFWVFLQFIELPGDAINFEIQSENFGLRRFQSLGIVGQGFVFAMLLRWRMREFLGFKSVYLLPLLGGVVGVGLLSGHRWVIVILGGTLVFCAFAQRLMTFKNTALISVTVAIGILCAYTFARDLPLTVQRALSVLPGINIDNQAFVDGAATLETRRLLRQVGMQMIPEYLWMGRGFGLSSAVDYSALWDPTGVTMHVNGGKFYNAYVGLMVNMGLFGTLFMLMFLVSGSMVALRIVFHLRRHGCGDPFLRLCSVVASLWMAHVVGFLFIHGDAEFAMKNFSFEVGILLVCDHLLKQRLLRRETANAAESEPKLETLPALHAPMAR